MLQTADAPPFRSSTADIVHAWQDCASAVEGQDLKVNEVALKASGWIPTRFAVLGKPIGDEFYSRPDVNAIIVVDKACFVEALTPDKSVVEEIRKPIADRVSQIAAKRGVKFENWVSNGDPAFGAKAFNVVIYYPSSGHSLLEVVSGDLGDLKPIQILTVDAAQVKK